MYLPNRPAEWRAAQITSTHPLDCIKDSSSSHIGSFEPLEEDFKQRAYPPATHSTDRAARFLDLFPALKTRAAFAQLRVRLTDDSTGEQIAILKAFTTATPRSIASREIPTPGSRVPDLAISIECRFLQCNLGVRSLLMWNSYQNRVCCTEHSDGSRGGNNRGCPPAITLNPNSPPRSG